MPPSEIFFSHSTQDGEVAARVVSVLRRHGLPVWYSATQIRGAQQWHDEIGAALGRCDWFVLLLTPAAVESMWVKRELLFALNQERYENRIVPLLVRDCDVDRLSWVLPVFQTIDFRGDFNVACREMLRVWGIGYLPES